MEALMHALSYLFFDGRTEEALAFYEKAIGITDKAVMKFSQSPDQNSIPPNGKDKVMHAQFKIGDTTIFGSDGECRGAAKFDGFSITINADSVGDAERVFKGLSAEGTVN